MSDEIKLQVSFTCENGNDKVVMSPGQVNIDQTNQGHFDTVVGVTTTEQSVAFTGISTAGQVIIQNLGTAATNYVQYGKTAGAYIGRIYGAKTSQKGTIDKLSWEPGAALYIVGNAAQKVRVVVCEK